LRFLLEILGQLGELGLLAGREVFRLGAEELTAQLGNLGLGVGEFLFRRVQPCF